MNMTDNMQRARELAVRFHDTYERLAPSFGYETRQETRQFDPETPNGRLMIAVCAELAANPSACELGAVQELPAKWRQRAEQKISASQHASIEQKCIARFRADDELARANELEADLAKPQSGEVS